jgi:hypothetical protein
MSDDFNNIVIGKDGLPRTRTVDEWNHLPDAEKAQILTQWSKTWSAGGSGAGPINRTRSSTTMTEAPKVFDVDDHSIGIQSEGRWRPSASELIGTHENDWK